MFPPVFKRSISWVVLLTFLTATFEQGALAAGQSGAQARKPGQSVKTGAPAKASSATPRTQVNRPEPVAKPIVAAKPAAPSQLSRYGRGLERLHDLAAAAQAKQGQPTQTQAKQAQPKAGGAQDAGAEIKRVRAQQRELEALEGEVEAEFAATDKHLKDHKLPAAIQSRHAAAVKEFHTRQAELKQRLKALDDADDAVENEKGSDKDAVARRETAKTTRAQKLTDLDGYLKAHQKHEAQRPADLAHPGFGEGATQPKKRAPRQTQREYLSSLFKPEPVHLAGPIPNGYTLPVATLPATPAPADTAATEDITLTPAIRAQAAALNNNPVQIYNWVRNNIEYIPSYGSIQGADLTLQNKRGNDMDSASLLIALYRAANIPARYVYGTIEVPGNRAANWLGVSTPDAALQLLQQGGVPSQAVVTGGVTTALQLEHVWVEAWVDYTPSRGAINKNPDTWVALDPSFKQYNETAGLNLSGAVSLNAQGVLDSARQGAACSADTALGLNAANLTRSYTNYKTGLANYLAQQGPDLTVGAVLGMRGIVAENHPILMGSLPYTTIVEAGQFSVLPDPLRWKFSYTLYADAAARAQGINTLTYTASLPSLLGHRLTVSYGPASAADAATLASYLPATHANGTPILASEFPATLPAYLINLRPELRLDGVVVAAGGAFVMGSQQTVSGGLFMPAVNQWDNRDHDITAGE